MLWHDQRLPSTPELWLDASACVSKTLMTVSGCINEWLRSRGTLQRWDEIVHAAAILQSWLLQDGAAATVCLLWVISGTLAGQAFEEVPKMIQHLTCLHETGDRELQLPFASARKLRPGNQAP